MVHLQPYYRCSALRPDPLDFERALFRPLKMAFPLLCPRVEQCNCLPRQGKVAPHGCMPMSSRRLPTKAQHVPGPKAVYQHSDNQLEQPADDARD
jgi:hypothetical protein